MENGQKVRTEQSGKVLFGPLALPFKTPQVRGVLNLQGNMNSRVEHVMQWTESRISKNQGLHAPLRTAHANNAWPQA